VITVSIPIPAVMPPVPVPPIGTPIVLIPVRTPIISGSIVPRAVIITGSIPRPVKNRPRNTHGKSNSSPRFAHCEKSSDENGNENQ
jgi:hypothetical protein